MVAVGLVEQCVVRLETGPDPYRFADDDELRALLRSAGLTVR
jgi:hypothetical protein